MSKGTNFKYGLRSRGAPVNTGWAGMWGNVWFVDGDNGNDAEAGTSPSSAVATVGKAVGLASSYDTIYVRPLKPDADASDLGVYQENQVIPYAMNNLSIISTTTGSQESGARLKSSAAGYVIDNYAANFALENFTIHNSEGASGTGGIYLRGASGYTTAAGSVGSRISNCLIQYGAVTTSSGIYSLGGSDIVIEGCTFKSCGTSIYLSGNTAIARNHQIIDCNFMSHLGTSTAYAMVHLEGSMTEILVKDSHFDQGTLFINCSGAVDGMADNCFFNAGAITPGTDGAAIDTGSGSFDIVGCFDQAGIVQEA